MLEVILLFRVANERCGHAQGGNHSFAGPARGTSVLEIPARSTRELIFRLRVKGVRLRGKTREASLCLIRFGTLVCYTAVCFS